MEAKKEIMAKVRGEKGMECLLECLLDCMLDIRDCLGALRDPEKIFKTQKVPKQAQQVKQSKQPPVSSSVRTVKPIRYPRAVNVRVIKGIIPKDIIPKKIMPDFKGIIPTGFMNKQPLSFEKEKQAKIQPKQRQYKVESKKVKAERKPLDKQARKEFRRKVKVRREGLLKRARKT